MCQTTAKCDIRTHVLTNKKVADGFYRMTVELSGAKEIFSPGQFFNLRIYPDRNDPLLRRPFAPSDLTESTMSFVYAVVGSGTELMSKLNPNDEVSVLLPLGNGFSLPEDSDTTCIFVGGGCGAPSLHVAAKAAMENGNPVYITLGARSKCTLLEVDAMGSVADRFLIVTDDGSEGMKGNAVMGAEKLLEKAKGKYNFYACGPEPMLKGLSKLAEEKGAFCEVSLEARMACGIGACVGCVVKVSSEKIEEGFVYKKVCQDGPVFRSTDLIWG